MRILTLLTATVVCLVGCSKKPAESTAVSEAAAPLPEASAALPRTPAPAGARVFIISPQDGAEVSSPFTVEFGAEQLAIVPAGDQASESGHHHLIINGDLPDLSQPIPANETYVHFGKGQKMTELSLAPGEHTLQLLAGDYLHIPHEPAVVSERITVRVLE